MFLPFVSILNASTVWERLLDEVSPARVTSLDDTSTPVEFIQNFETSVPQATLRLAAENRGIEYLAKSPFWSHVPVRSIERTLDSPVTSKLPILSSMGNDGYIFLGAGRDYRDQQVIVDRLSGARAVLHIDVGLAGALCREGGIPWQHLQLPQICEEALSRRIDAGWSRFLEFQRDYDGEHPQLFSNPYLNFQFRFYCERLLETSRVIAATDAVLDAFPAKILVVSNTISELRGAVYAARRRGVRTVELVHGGIAYLQLYDFAADRMVVWGTAQRQELERFGRDGARILEGGAYLYPATPPDTEDSQGDRLEERRRLLRSIGRDESTKIVLLMSSQTNIELTVPARVSHSVSGDLGKPL